MNSNRQIKLGALMSYVTIGFNILAGLIYTPWMIGIIGKSNFGLYTLAVSLISIFLLDFGISSAVTRFVSKYNAEGNQEKTNNLLGIVYKLYFIIDIVIFLVLLIVYFNIDNIYTQLTLQELEKFKIVYIIAAIFNLISFPFITLNGILIAYEKFIQIKLVDLLNKIFTVITTVYILIIGGGLFSLVIINALWNLVAIFAKIIIINRKTPIKINYLYSHKGTYKMILGFSMWVTIVSISQRFIFNLTPSILGMLLGSTSIAIFGIASIIEGYIYTFASAINGLFMAKVSRIVSKNEENDDILHLMLKVGRIQLLVIGLIIIGFLSVGRDFMTLWMGEEYILVYYCVIPMIIPSIISLTQEIGDTAVVVLNKVRLQAYIFIAMAVTNVILSVIFTKYWGVVGASISIFFAYMVRTIGMNFIYYKEININIFYFFKECHVKMMPSLMVSLMIGYFTNMFIPSHGWLNLLVKIIVIVITYIIIMWLFAMNKYEKGLVNNMLKRIFQK